MENIELEKIVKEKLKKGDTFTSMKQLLYYVGFPKTRSQNSTLSQIKQLEQYVKIVKSKKNSSQVQIGEIYKIPKEKQDNRIKVDYSSFNVLSKYKNKGGVYKIYNNDFIYIGQTYNFIKRYSQHICNPRGLANNTQKLLKNGGIFEILELEENLNKRLLLERDYIEYYDNDKRYDCINISYNPSKRPKYKSYKKIKILESDYEKVVELLKKEGINYD